MNPALQRQRIDKWMWAARFYKTRALASEDLGLGRVSVNGQVCKASREVQAGDRVAWRQGSLLREVEVLGLSAQRGPAPAAQLLYRESEESLQRRADLAEAHRLAPEPAHSMTQGRPTKRDRRDQRALTQGWNERWSASAD